MHRLSASLFLMSGVVFAQGIVTIPAGAELTVRLRSPVSSNSSKAAQKIEAITIAPLVEGDGILLPAGIVVKGEIAALTPTVKPDERASLQLSFSEIGGVKASTKVLDIDNAREHVDDAGKIVGILASETLAARINQGIGKVAQRNATLASILDVAKMAVLASQPSGEIKYEPGVELKIRVEAPLQWKRSASDPSPPGVKSISNTAVLSRLVNSQPLRTMTENPVRPSDLTSLMFIGTEAQLLLAFEKAGWTEAHERNAGSVMETVRAIAELRGYKEAPMSTLTLDGRRSNFDFQKQNNTFAKRHHLRIWRRPGTFQENPVWVCSATHDIGIEFSQENGTFIHVIDPLIDRERAKVVNDLLFTGHVRSLALVDRPEAPKKTRNGTGDEMETDGRMAVLVLQ